MHYWFHCSVKWNVFQKSQCMDTLNNYRALLSNAHKTLSGGGTLVFCSASTLNIVVNLWIYFIENQYIWWFEIYILDSVSRSGKGLENGTLKSIIWLFIPAALFFVGEIHLQVINKVGIIFAPPVPLKQSVHLAFLASQLIVVQFV